MTDDDDARLFGRVGELIAHAIAALDPQDIAERIEYCREHDQHGTRMHFTEGDDLVEFRWGGRRLAMVHRDTLDNDRPMQFGFVNDPPTPDTVPDEWTLDA